MQLETEFQRNMMILDMLEDEKGNSNSCFHLQVTEVKPQEQKTHHTFAGEGCLPGEETRAESGEEHVQELLKEAISLE